MRRLWTPITGTDPRRLQFDFALWTTQMVRELIHREFGVGLSPVSVGRLLAPQSTLAHSSPGAVAVAVGPA